MADRRHVFLSYDANSVSVCRALVEKLYEKKVPVYYCPPNSADVNSAMAKGVDNAAVFIPIITEDFQQSRLCSKCFNYADQRALPVVCVKGQEDWNPTSWLGALAAGKATLNIASPDEATDHVIDQLVQEITARWKDAIKADGDLAAPVPEETGDALFLGGEVTGFWRLPTGDEGQMTFEYLAMERGLVRGQGGDEVGDFTIMGTYDRDNMTLEFTKQYIGLHKVIYTGTIEGAPLSDLKLTGTWEIPGDWSGDFELNCRASSVTAVTKKDGTYALILAEPSDMALAERIGHAIEALGTPCIVIDNQDNADAIVKIGDAAVVCPVMSPAYQNSTVCREILSYADSAAVPVVPIMAVSKWMQSSWLALITGGLLYTDVSNPDTFDSQMQFLQKEIKQAWNGASCQENKVQDAKKEKHVMLSYQWAVQDLVKKIHDGLKDRGIPVWFDIAGDMTGNINTAMADGVENAAVVCSFVSQPYANSRNCSKEIMYASQLQTPILPIVIDAHVVESNNFFTKLVEKCADMRLDVNVDQMKQNEAELNTNLDTLAERIKPILESTKGADGEGIETIFEGGAVSGYWELETGDRGDMHFENLSLVNGRVRGQGDDSVGPFTLCGTYTVEGDTVSMKFEKQYQTYLVNYEGSGEKTPEGVVFEGMWNIPGDWSGTFQISCLY
eukprot:TRINITY_DN1048_c0_g1::TRINITY_DN1048_c0_g1_i1::g.29949::m.29949 TRINITY_DN1048_c0_g1::TRINITY_DN1048_c0_g1_i1::g.29949  ORF type:complete len:672 (+),score=240.25,TIR_2/PF13676.1/5.7e-06,TIR_2/PF13676.1/0.0017,TIR_2/PF13676.1/3.3e-16,TIR/PF01582.15/3,TIR/PF01582.15/5.4e+03,TIR/PF01582.15/0.096,DUF237/PF03072.9/8.7,DUF237/PF03072.9/2.9,DUF1863/PF08937.6/4.3e+03,DUF1863/PF08937.6/6.4e+03,DUF1863/PF08937.6/0.11 TRINITY_DN1048_c0_g1_i1:88-2103(+)